VRVQSVVFLNFEGLYVKRISFAFAVTA